MEIKINQKVFIEGLQKATGVTERRTASPILNNVLLKAAEGKLALIATDMSMSIITSHDAVIAEEGQITLPAHKLHEMVKEIDSEEIHLLQKGAGPAQINAGKSRYKIPWLPASDFPSVADVDGVEYSEIPASALTSLINQVSPSSAPDNDNRASLRSALFITGADHNGGGVWQMVATDGHRMSIAATTTEGKALDTGKGVIIPSKGLSEIKKIINGQETVGVGINKNMLVFKAGDTILKVNLVDEKYPDYKRVIPSGDETSIPLEKKSFLRVLRRIAVVSSGKFNDALLSLSNGKLTIQSVNLDVGEAVEDMEVDYAGEDLEIGVNIDYIIDAVSSAPGENITLNIRDGIKPVMFKSEEDSGYRCIVMPLKIHWRENSAAA